MKAILLCLCACLLLFSCQKENATPTSVSIRVANASQYQLEDIVVTTPGGQNNYGALGVGQNSDYKPFSQAYSYAHIKLTAQGQDLVIQPFDYVGKKKLEPGRYTYVLDVIDGSPKRLTLRLEK